MLAFPHATVPTKELMVELQRLVSESACQGFVMGLPNAWGIEMGKGITHSTEAILQFRDQLKKRWPALEVVTVDETNTSEEALQASISGGMKKSKRAAKGALDHVAAAIILQRYLDR